MAKRVLLSILAAAFVLLFGGLLTSQAAAGTITSADKYAWGENFGWIDFACSQCTVTVSDDALAGFAWSRDAGWLNLSPAEGGVTNDGAGHLGGYAWSSTLGWITFSGVVIDPADGKLIGTAGVAGTHAGRIIFNC